MLLKAWNTPTQNQAAVTARVLNKKVQHFYSTCNAICFITCAVCYRYFVARFSRNDALPHGPVETCWSRIYSVRQYSRKTPYLASESVFPFNPLDLRLGWAFPSPVNYWPRGSLLRSAALIETCIRESTWNENLKLCTGVTVYIIIICDRWTLANFLMLSASRNVSWRCIALPNYCLFILQLQTPVSCYIQFIQTVALFFCIFDVVHNCGLAVVQWTNNTIWFAKRC